MPEISAVSQPQPITTQMQALAQQWQAAADQRSIFLSCYALMTGNMLNAIAAGEFNDSMWVDALLHRFANYYFMALHACEQHSPVAPAVWQITFAAARQPETIALQNLLLGVNAHINYDLVLTLVDLLEPEWAQLSPAQRQQRYADHCHVNHVISRTIDAVQDDILEPLAPALDIVDSLMGRLDEWLISRLITHWRDEVWAHAVQFIDTPNPVAREQLRRQVEATTVNRANAILLRADLAAIRHLL